MSVLDPAPADLRLSLDPSNTDGSELSDRTAGNGGPPRPHLNRRRRAESFGTLTARHFTDAHGSGAGECAQQACVPVGTPDAWHFGCAGARPGRKASDNGKRTTREDWKLVGSTTRLLRLGRAASRRAEWGDNSGRPAERQSTGAASRLRGTTPDSWGDNSGIPESPRGDNVATSTNKNPTTSLLVAGVIPPLTGDSHAGFVEAMKIRGR